MNSFEMKARFRFYSIINIKVSEIITPFYQATVAGLIRNAKEAPFALKQERCRQRLKRDSDRMRKTKSQPRGPKASEPPKPPTL